MRKQALAKSGAVTLKNQPKLDAIAERIRTRAKRMRDEIVAIGRDLIAAKALAGHGGWLPWLEAEFGWKERAAQTFMSVAEAAAKNAKFADLNVPVSGLYLLAAPKTPPAAVEAVAERSEAGEKLSLADVKDVIAQAHQAPKAKPVRRDPPKPYKELPRELADRWRMSLSNIAGQVAALSAFWDREFGPGWRAFKVPSDLAQLTSEATETWQVIADEVKAAAAPKRQVDPPARTMH